jgi:hypothetical protein
MEVTIEKDRYDQLIATEKKVNDFIQAMDDLAHEGYVEDDPDFLGNPDFNDEQIASLVMKHFDLYEKY